MSTRKVIIPILLVLFISLVVVIQKAQASDIPWADHKNLATSFDGAHDVDIVDIDGDGDLDVVGVASVDHDVAWWENTAGDGSAWTRNNVYSDFNGARSVQGVDMDGDGDADILTTASDHDDITWWENKLGDGSLWIRRDINYNFDGAYDAYAADIDGDSDMDVVAIGLNLNTLTWWENTDSLGTTWTKRNISTSFSTGRSVHAADLDGDGDTDILAASYEEDAIYWWENNNGLGTSWSQQTVYASFDGAYDVFAADMNNDGDMDVLGAASNANDIVWWENSNGAGWSWYKRDIDLNCGGARSVHAADMDQDGDMDVLGVCWSYDEITWWENTNQIGTDWQTHNLSSNFNGARSADAGDLDHDGDLDVVGAASESHDITMWENETIHRTARFGGLLQEQLIPSTIDSLNPILSVDIDRDGDEDLLTLDWVNESIQWHENGGNGETWTDHGVADGFYGLEDVNYTDVDGDGDQDIIAAATSDTRGNVIWWENVNEGASWTEHMVNDTIVFADHVTAADLDLDGDQDIIISRSDTSGRIYWFENDADGTSWTQHTAYGNANRISNAIPIDLDQDGDYDLVSSASESGNNIFWVENQDGTGGTWTYHAIAGDFPYPLGTGLADMDKDGDLDILCASSYDDEIAWWENTGSDTNWPKHTLASYFDGPYGVWAWDLDNDGDQDVIGTTATHNSIYWWENRGTGTSWTSHTIDSSANLIGFSHCADLDNDGDLDIISSIQGDDKLVWWENYGGQYSLNAARTAPSQMNLGTSDDVLRIQLVHLGQTGDNDVEFASIKLRMQGCIGSGCSLASLTSAKVNEIFDELNVYLDDGNGSFSSSADTKVSATITDFNLTNGILDVELMDNGGNMFVGPGESAYYFVVLHRAQNAPANPSVERIVITLLNESYSMAEDRTNDGLLLMEYRPNYATNTIVMQLPPNAVNDAGANFTTDEDSSFGTPNVLTNDTDINGDSINLESINTSGTLGLVSNNNNGTFTYNPSDAFNSLAVGETASDSFTYTIRDSHNNTDTATVTITITGINDSPTANDNNGTGYKTDYNTPFTTPNVLGNDTDPDGDTLYIQGINTTGTRGLVWDNGDGTFDYDPNGQFSYLASNESETDTFTYTATDFHNGTSTATVTIVVSGVNIPPVANNDEGFGFATTKNAPFITRNVLLNDTDENGNPLTVVGFDLTGTVGLATNNGDGTFSYDPNGQFDYLESNETATDSFTYAISDGFGGTDSATVYITVVGGDSIDTNLYLPIFMH